MKAHAGTGSIKPDLTSFLAPVRRFNTSAPDPGFDTRWDIVPGAGLFSKSININDLTSLIVVAPPPETSSAPAKMSSLRTSPCVSRWWYSPESHPARGSPRSIDSSGRACRVCGRAGGRRFSSSSQRR